MSGFSRHRRSGAAVATFTVFEADLLRSLAGQLIELLRNESATASQDSDPLERLMDFTGPTSAPDDPVLARLFPTAYPEDEEAAGDFRRFTESTLRDGKAGAAASVIDTLEEAGLPPEPEDGMFIDVELDEEAAMLWMRSFTDMRLAIATRLGVEEGDEEYWYSLPDDDPRPQVHDVYDWLGLPAGDPRRRRPVSRPLTGVRRPRADRVRRAPPHLTYPWTVLTLTPEIRDAIVAHAKRDHPDEACGVVAGPEGSDQAVRFVEMTNAAGSPTFYEFDSTELLQLYKEMDANDEEPVVIYHSHTSTEAYPSRTDIGLASEPGAHYVLVSTREHGNSEGPVEFRSYRIDDGEVTEEEVVVTEEPARQTTNESE